MVALAAADERGAEVEVFGPFRLGGGEDFVEQQAKLAGRERGDGPAGFGMVLDAETGVKEAEILGDLGDGGDGGLARTAGAALLDGDGRRDSAEPVDVGPRQLFDKLPGVGRHRFHEAPLALREDDVEGQGGLARAGNAGDDRELPMRDGD